MFIVVGLLFGLGEMLHTIRFWLLPIGQTPPINGAVWTLIYEEVCYLLMAAFSIVGLYRFRLFPVFMALACAAMVATNQYFRIPPALVYFGGAFFIGNTAYLMRGYLAKVPAWVSVPAFAAVVAFTLALLAAGGVAFLWWQYREFYVALDGADAEIAGALERIRANQRALSDRIDAIGGAAEAT